MGKMNLSELERDELEGLQRKRTAPVAQASGDDARRDGPKAVATRQTP